MRIRASWWMGIVSASAGLMVARAANVEPPTVETPAVMRQVYLGLVRESIVPADPQRVAAAAFALLPAGQPRTFPPDFGRDFERDAAWFGQSMAPLASPWPAVEAMVRAADTEHVGFVTPVRRQGLRALMSGHPLSSSGFNFHPLPGGGFAVFEVIAGASAHASGFRVGDVLRKINGQEMVRTDQFRLSLLPAGTEVPLEIERDGHVMSLVLRLAPADISPVESRLLANGAAYVSIRWFARSDDPQRDTAALVLAALAKLAGAKGLVLDLRSALGGAGEVRIASALCDGAIIYSVQKNAEAPRPVGRDGPRTWPDRPIVVLVNELTVSAGEDLALALRELGRAKIVGRPTGGALTEMSFQPLAEGYALAIPTAVILGPVSGRDQPGHAVVPDVDLPNASCADLLAGRDPQLEIACRQF
jgi:C-terminal processing protease CtpA/Prc